MKWEVQLYQGGSVFTEEVYANDYQDAKATAQARNPTVKIIGCNPIVGDTNSWDDDDDDDDTNTSQSSSSSFNNSGTDVGGMLGLCAVLFVLWLIIEYWMFIIPITLIIAILYFFINKEN